MSKASDDQVSAGLADEVARLKAEAAATATKAERIADPSLQPAAPAQTKAQAAMDLVAKLPPEVVVRLLVLGLDLAGRRVAMFVAGKEAGTQYALTADERELLTQVWVPVAQLYLPALLASGHPLLIAGGITVATYAFKSLPEGGLEALLGGGPAPASQAEMSTAELVNPPPPDPALHKVQAAIEQLRKDKAAA